MIIEREELMVPPPTNHNNAIPKLQKSHFLNPTNTNQPLPKPQFNPLSIDPKIIKELTKIINFKGIKIPNDSWKTWVDNLRSTHQTIWQKAGIFDAIKATTFTVKRDDELIIKLAYYWCPETNTFVFPWGECTITLEDVMILGGFSLLGEPVHNVSECSNYGEIHEKLESSCLEIKRKNNYHVPFNEWIKYFRGKGDDLEHVGFLVQWLSRYVFAVNQFDIDVNSFRFAVCLSQGSKIALAPAVLASIYSDLTLLKRKIVAFNGGCGDNVDNDVGKSKLVLWSPMQLVQIWAWERFPMLSPTPKPLLVGEPRVARWHKLFKLKLDSLSYCMDSGSCGFLWRPYAKNLENWEFPKFYSDEGMIVVVNDEVDEEWLSFAKCLGVSELVGMGFVEQYLPHRVGMQFGFDQDIAHYVPRLNDDMKDAWSSYDKPLDGVKLYIPPRLFEGEVTERYSNLWVRVSHPQGDALKEPGKKKRKRGPNKPKAKKTSNLEESTVSSSWECNKTVDFAFSGNGKEISIEKSSVNVDDEIVSHSLINSSQSINLIDKIDSSMATNGDLLLNVPSQGQDNGKSSFGLTVISINNCSKTINFASSGNDKEISIEKSSVNVDDEKVSHSLMNSSQSINLIDKIDSSMATSEDLLLNVPFQGPDNGKPSFVPAGDDHREDAMEAKLMEIMNDFNNWRRDHS